MKENGSQKTATRLVVMAIAAAVVSIIVMAIISKDSDKGKQSMSPKESEGDIITIEPEKNTEAGTN